MQMQEDICANCGAHIYLKKTGPNLFRWVSNLDRPDMTRYCDLPPEFGHSGAPKDIGFPPRMHAPVSMREARR
jgi:hypothetical protein